MKNDETVLSDVSLYTEPAIHEKEGDTTVHVSTSYKFASSRFTFSTPSFCESENGASKTLTETDEDGDFILKRKSDSNYIIIEHAMDTRLKDVGLQVWQGSLLLCDFILHNRSIFDGSVAIELGGGVGLVAITMATVARHVMTTDIGDDVLALCERSINLNQHLYKYNSSNDEDKQDVVVVRELNWLQCPLELFKLCEPKKEFDIVASDKKLLETSETLLAADVIYDDNLTDAFFSTVNHLMSIGKPKTLYLAVEKRLNFTLSDLDIACPAYEYFAECLEECKQQGYITERMNTDFPQHFRYERTRHLELWKMNKPG